MTGSLPGLYLICLLFAYLVTSYHALKPAGVHHLVFFTAVHFVAIATDGWSFSQIKSMWGGWCS